MTVWAPFPPCRPIGPVQWYMNIWEWRVPVGPEFCFVEDEVWNVGLVSGGADHFVEFNVTTEEDWLFGL